MTATRPKSYVWLLLGEVSTRDGSSGWQLVGVCESEVEAQGLAWDLLHKSETAARKIGTIRLLRCREFYL